MSEGTSKNLKHIIVSSIHPQMFCLPWGKTDAVLQDRLLWIAHRMARLSCNKCFYRSLSPSFLDKFPKRNQYPRCKELPQVEAARQRRKIPFMTVTSSKLSSVSSGTWNAAKPSKNLLADADENAFLRATKPATSGSKHAGSVEVSPDIEMAVQQTPWVKAVNTVVNSSEDRNIMPGKQDLSNQLYKIAL
jgi:hypothetical protein